MMVMIVVVMTIPGHSLAAPGRTHVDTPNEVTARPNTSADHRYCHSTATDHRRSHTSTAHDSATAPYAGVSTKTTPATAAAHSGLSGAGPSAEDARGCK
jgi:hypothetical protein